MPTRNERNLEWWEKYGDYVLMAMPYADQVLVDSKGSTLVDADGNEILDLASGMFCSVLGHKHPEFVRRVARQAETLLHTGTQYVSPALLEASYKLAQVTPGKLQKSIFLSTGTEANEFAFRIAKAYTGRTGIVGFSRGYYGTSLATKSCSSLFAQHLGDSAPAVSGSYRLPISAECRACFRDQHRTCDHRCLEDIGESVGDWSNIAAVIAEPILSAGGMLFPPSGYLAELKEIAHRNGALFIVDEAQTGFGRTGKWFAIEHHGVEPDILTMSKSLGNGFPVAAVITTADIADRVVGSGLWNLSSHQSDPIAASAVAAVIDIVREERLMERAAESGAYFMQRLNDLAARCPAISGVRGQGLMIGFDLLADVPDRSPDAANSFMLLCRERGLHLTYCFGDVTFRIIPPLVITRAEIDKAMDIIDAALQEVLSNPGVGKSVLAANPHLRRSFERGPLRRVVEYCWRSSPETLVAKGKEIVRQRMRQESAGR